jgi:pimeloyl-ACP methyl ester carboxylesterase
VTRRESRNVEVGDLTMSYYDEGDGPVFLLVHGFSGSKLDFHDQIGWFSDRYRVIAPDNRGHGETSHTGDASSYSIDAIVDDLHRFTDALGIKEFHLLGHSLGGMVAMRYALAHQDTLRSLILMDTSAKALDVPRGVLGMTAKVLQEGGTTALLELMKAGPATPEVQNGIDYLGEEEHWNRIGEKLAQMDQAAYICLADILDDLPDITPTLAAIEVPTTVIVGAADAPFIESSRAMAATIPHARLEIITDASHCPQYENAEAWREVIGRHLARA